MNPSMSLSGLKHQALQLKSCVYVKYLSPTAEQSRGVSLLTPHWTHYKAKEVINEKNTIKIKLYKKLEINYLNSNILNYLKTYTKGILILISIENHCTNGITSIKYR